MDSTLNPGILDEAFQINANALGLCSSSLQARSQGCVPFEMSFPATPSLLISDPNRFEGNSRVAPAISFSIRSLKPISLAGTGIPCEQVCSGRFGSHISKKVWSDLS